MTVDRVKPHIMNVKCWKILVRLFFIDILLHAAAARWRWSGFLLSGSMHCIECLSRQFCLPWFSHITQRYKAIDLSLIICLWYTWSKAPGSLRRSNEENVYYVFKICMTSVCTRLVVPNVIRILLHLETSASSWAHLANAIWLFI